MYKSELIDNDAYLDHITRYIHCNPIKLFAKHNDDASLEQRLLEYPWSSYPAYAGKGHDPIVDVNLAEEYFGGVEEYRAFMRAGIKWRNLM